MGNPFLEDTGDLVSLAISCIMPKEVVETVKTIKDVGEEQWRSLVSDRMETQKVPFTSTIHLNKLPFFSDKPEPSKQKSNVVALKDVIILDGAFIVQMAKPGNAATFEEYANNIFLPRVMFWLRSASRIDVVWDCYKSDSL